jgi:DNA segregation ATPase FtsK/SpoIIIE, S-DNA-T family
MINILIIALKIKKHQKELANLIKEGSNITANASSRKNEINTIYVRLENQILNYHERSVEQVKQKISGELSIISEYLNLAETKVKQVQDKISIEELKQSNILNGIGDPCLPWDKFELGSGDNYLKSPFVIRVGELATNSTSGIIPIRRLNDNLPGHICIFSNDRSSRRSAVAAIQSIALRVISTFPILKAKCVFIDSVNSGDNFPFSNLPESIRDKQVYTREEDIRDQLRKLTIHVQNIIQNYLGSNFHNIEEYNQSAAIQEPYRYLFITDFPNNFNTDTYEELLNLLINGAKAGVYVIVHVDESLDKPKELDFNVFRETCINIKPAINYVTNGSFDRPGIFKIGSVYVGRVNHILPTGVYVDFLPGKEGFITTERLTVYHISHPLEAIEVGTTIPVKVLDIDRRNKISLACVGIELSEMNSAIGRVTEEDGNPLFKLQFPSGLNFEINLECPPPPKKIIQITDIIAELSTQIKPDIIKFSDLYPKRLWTEDSREEIHAPIGVIGNQNNLEFWMGQNQDGLQANNGLLAGKPGSGKSFTLHAIILSLAMQYAPSELELYLLDFKEGVEFQIYVDPERLESQSSTINTLKALPHARLISTESDREFALSVLQKVVSEIEIRAEQFRTTGASNLKSYRDLTGCKMPRILTAIDEFQNMIQENDRITSDINDCFDTIIRQGRAFGIHLLLASQSLNISNMKRSLYDSIDLRMGMQMNESTAVSVFAEGNASVVNLLDRPGKIVYNSDMGRKGHNQIGQIADLSLEYRKEAMNKIYEEMVTQEYHRKDRLILFNGSQSTSLSQNPYIEYLSNLNQPLSPTVLNREVIKDPDWSNDESPSVGWLGESMQIGKHTQAIFRQRSRSNMLLIGNSTEIIMGILGGLLISLVHSCQSNLAKFYIIDSHQQEDESNNMLETFYRKFSSHFSITLGQRSPKVPTIANATNTLNDVYLEFKHREQERLLNPNNLDFGQQIFFVYIIGGTNRSPNLLPILNNRNSEEMSDDANKLSSIVSQGAELGIHTILWIDRVPNFFRVFNNSRSAFSYFDMRVALKMSPDDSRKFLDEPYANNLQRLLAYFYDASVGLENLEKFKPYAALTLSDLDRYSQKFNQRLNTEV